MALVPAGTHRGKAIVDELIRTQGVDEVVWDPGYSLCSAGTTHHKLAQAGIAQTFPAADAPARREAILR